MLLFVLYCIRNLILNVRFKSQRNDSRFSKLTKKGTRMDECTNGFIQNVEKLRFKICFTNFGIMPDFLNPFHR